MEELRRLENQSIYIIREAYAQLGDVAMLWSIGKDSTTLLWLIRKAFFGKIPFPVIHIDTSFKFKEIYKFRDYYAKKWGMNLLIARNDEALKKGIVPEAGKFNCCSELKTNALKQLLLKHKFKGLLLAIRRDEHGIRAKERVFSPRTPEFTWNYFNQPVEMWGHYDDSLKTDEHLRIHPLLGWREVDVWEYVKKEKIPVVSLYKAKNQVRFRSIGCACCCSPVPSEANTIDKIVKELKVTRISERSGRAQDKEDMYTMAKLRSLGYM